uniref:Uncharacterized protein n=1 Tax=Anthurium amnicola TaxID=1678845 RepID=A0A1D1YFX5_9ARAE
MDEYSGKRAAGRMGFSRRGSSLTFRESHEDRGIQSCNRIGCSTRHNTLKATQIGNPENVKSSRLPFVSTRSKAAVGDSSRTFTALNIHEKPQWERGSPSLLERATAEISARQEQIEDIDSSIKEEEMITFEVDAPSAVKQTVLPEPLVLESSFVEGLSINATEASLKCQLTSSSRAWKPSNRNKGSSNRVVSSSSSVQCSALPRIVNHTVTPSQNQGTNVQRHGLRNLSCTSISDVLPSGCSSSDVGRTKRTESLRKRDNDGLSSSARGKGTGESSNGGNQYSLGSTSSGPCLSPLERPLPQPASRRTRNRLTSGGGAVSVRTQRSDSGNSRRLSESVDADTFFRPEIMIRPSSQAQFSLCDATAASSSRSFPTEFAPLTQSSSGRPGSSSRTGYARPVGHSDDNNFRNFRGPWVDRDGYRHFNMEGIGEVLLALERIEQDEELTYEQLMVLESNIFLGGIGFHDQHRDLRLDIDNMSYEVHLCINEMLIFCYFLFVIW